MSDKLPLKQPEINPRRAIGISLVATVIGLFILAIGLLIISPPLTLDLTENTAHIAFSAQKRSVVLPGDCVTASWSVDGIKEVYINGQATIGSDSKQFCITTDSTSLPTLRVVFQDGSIKEYQLPVGITVRSPLFALVVTLILIMALLALVLFSLPLLSKILGYLKRPLRIIEVLIVSLIVLFTLSEIALRVYLSNFGTEKEKIMYLYSPQDIKNLGQQLISMPYVNYVASPNFTDHNSLGYRGTDVQIPKPAGVFRIVTLGGSTTYSSSTRSEDSYPSQLQLILRSDYHHPLLEVVNAGVPGYTSWDTLVNYMLRVTELQPDMILIYDGINDIQPRAVAMDCYRGINPWRGLDPMRGTFRDVQIPIESAFYRVIAIRLGWMPDPSTLTGATDPIAVQYCPERPALDNTRIAQNPPIYFERNMRDIIQLARANKVQVMFSTWTYDIKSPDEEQLPSLWRDEVPENNAIVKKLAAEFGLPLYDLAATDFGDQRFHWADPIHMSPAGTHEQARLYAAFIDSQHLIPSGY